LKIRNVLAPYVRELVGGIASSKLPIHDYGTEGGYGYFQIKLKDIITYPDLRPEVLQNFKEMGNLVIFLKQCDSVITQYDVLLNQTVAPFLGITTSPIEGDSTNAPLYLGVANLASVLENSPALAKAPTILRELVNNAWKADKFYRPLPQTGSIFKLCWSECRLCWTL